MRKVTPAETKKVEAAVSHLDLIRAGGFKLKKVDNTQPKPPVKEKIENKDPNTLTLAEILQKAASIRESVAMSDSDDDSEEDSSSYESW